MRGQVDDTIPSQEDLETVSDPPDIQEAFEEENEEVTGNEEEEQFYEPDHVADRDFSYPLVGKRIRCHYSSWVTGKFVWFNSALKKYRIQFEDGSEDYVSLNDISRGTNMFLLPDM